MIVFPEKFSIYLESNVLFKTLESNPERRITRLPACWIYALKGISCICILNCSLSIRLLFIWVFPNWWTTFLDLCINWTFIISCAACSDSSYQIDITNSRIHRCQSRLLFMRLRNSQTRFVAKWVKVLQCPLKSIYITILNMSIWWWMVDITFSTDGFEAASLTPLLAF